MQTLPSRFYQLERTATLSPAVWQAVGPTITGDGSVVGLHDTQPPVGRGFYRVRSWTE